MKERPILFSTPMIRAILDGKKTQTRRIVKHVEDARFIRAQDGFPDGSTRPVFEVGDDVCSVRCPYGEPGDRLWVKENYRLRADQDGKPPRDDWWKSGAWYAADGATPTGCGGGPGKLRPSIHMPRWASRITLEVTSVRVERLQDISEDDARAEGVVPELCLPGDDVSYVSGFALLWELLNHERAPWDSNPWVWVVAFNRIGGAS